MRMAFSIRSAMPSSSALRKNSSRVTGSRTLSIRGKNWSLTENFRLKVAMRKPIAWCGGGFKSWGKEREENVQPAEALVVLVKLALAHGAAAGGFGQRNERAGVIAVRRAVPRRSPRRRGGGGATGLCRCPVGPVKRVYPRGGMRFRGGPEQRVARSGLA